jgi:two-component system nitrogen regulation sensor histidine kinase NtrY
LKKYSTYILPLIGVLALLYVFFVPSEKNVKESAAVFSNYIIQQEKKFAEALPALSDSLCTNSDLIAFKEDKKLPFDLLLYKNDSIVAYTSNRSIPSLPVSLIEQRSVILSLNNGWYFLQKSQKNDREVVALSLLKDNFKIENEFLKNEIHFSNNISSNLAISDQNVEGSIPIRNIDGKNAGYVYINSALPDATLNVYSLLSILVILCIALFYIWQLCYNVVQKLNPLAGFGLMAILLFSVRVIMISGEFPKELSQLQLFSPTLYASSYFANSLGQLFISILFLLILAGFATYIKIKDFIITKHSKFLTVAMGLVTAILTTVIAVFLSLSFSILLYL